MTNSFRQSRLKNGYDFANKEFRLNFDENGKLLSQSVEDSTPSHHLVEECMLLANQEAAKKLQLKGIFRVHDQPTNSSIYELIDNVNALGLKVKLKSDIHTTILSIQEKARKKGLETEVDELIIKSQQMAYYSSVKKEHFGLGFENYSHFTSPIRRYADLVLHRILKTTLVPQDIDEICEDISNIERDIARLVWDFEDRVYARWAKENINNEFDAIVLDIGKKIAKIDDEFKNIKIEIENYSNQTLFSKIRVKIVNSDIITKKIVAKVISSEQ